MLPVWGATSQIDKGKNAQLRLMLTNVSRRFMAALMIKSLSKQLMYLTALHVDFRMQRIYGLSDLKVSQRRIY
jgi:hypothetical protein